MSFAVTLNQLMKDTGTSNVALGKAVGVSDVAVMKWKRGEAAPSLENAVNIAKYFGISVDDLAGNKLTLEGSSFVRLPVMGTASVYGITVNDLWADDYITISVKDLNGYPREECYAMSMRDNTLYPDYSFGISYPLFHQQNQCADGDTIIARNMNTKEYMFKVFHWDKDSIILSDPVGKYPDVIFRKQDVNKLKVEAVVIGVYLAV